MPGVKLKHLKIHQYRNVRPGTELRFDDGINLVLGQNGSGKTTLLGLISYAVSSDLAPLAPEAFDLEYELTDGQFSASLHIKNNPGNEDRGAADDFKYSVILSEHENLLCRIEGTQSGTTVLMDGTSHATSPASPFRYGFVLHSISAPSIPLQSTLTSTIRAAETALFDNRIPRFDESLDVFLAMTGRAPVSLGSGTPPPAQLIVNKIGDTPWRRRCIFAPSALVPLVPLAHASPGGELSLAASPTSEYDGLKFLIDVGILIGAPTVGWRPQITRMTSPPDAKWQIFEVEGFSFTFTRHDGSTINHELLSYGQKRLLAFFYYLAATQHVVIADELVNGLHHRWIAACMEAIGDRQAFLTSQNPLLFEYIEFDSIEQVQSRFITCKSEIVDGAEQLVWQNMPREDAERFYRGYQADIESIGDILINRGLW